MKDLIQIIRGVAILDSRAGSRLFAQYYSSATSNEHSGLSSTASQLAFESLFLSSIENIKKGTASYAYAQPDIIALEKNIVVFQLVAPDLVIMVIGADELSTNPLLLGSVLSTLMDALKAVIPSAVSTKGILESFDIVTVLFDELIDDGIPLELDASALVSRLPRRKLPDGSPSDIPLAEQTITQAIQTAKYWKETLLK